MSTLSNYPGTSAAKRHGAGWDSYAAPVPLDSARQESCFVEDGTDRPGRVLERFPVYGPLLNERYTARRWAGVSTPAKGVTCRRSRL